MLVKHRQIMDKLKDEVRITVGVGSDVRSPDRNDIKRMLYLWYVLKEGKRPDQLIFTGVFLIGIYPYSPPPLSLCTHQLSHGSQNDSPAHRWRP